MPAQRRRRGQQTAAASACWRLGSRRQLLAQKRVASIAVVVAGQISAGGECWPFTRAASHPGPRWRLSCIIVPVVYPLCRIACDTTHAAHCLAQKSGVSGWHCLCMLERCTAASVRACTCFRSALKPFLDLHALHPAPLKPSFCCRAYKKTDVSLSIAECVPTAASGDASWPPTRGAEPPPILHRAQMRQRSNIRFVPQIFFAGTRS